MTSGHDVSEYLGTLGLVKSYFSKFFLNREKKISASPMSPEDETICLFAGLLANPNMVLSLGESFSRQMVLRITTIT